MSTRPADTASLYPASSASRDRFVLDRRPARADHDPWRYQDVVVEDERAADGRTVRTATVFLTGRECPWRCVMCDLWRYTTPTDTPPGAIPAQVAAARERLRREQPPVTHLKLYNAGSFFDPRAVPEQDYEAVAAEVAGFARVTVESHPALDRRARRSLSRCARCPPTGERQLPSSSKSRWVSRRSIRTRWSDSTNG